MATVSPVAPARNARGLFQSPSDPTSIREVLLVPAWTIAYRVGPGGPIFAERAAAVRFANIRRAKNGGAA